MTEAASRARDGGEGRDERDLGEVGGAEAVGDEPQPMRPAATPRAVPMSAGTATRARACTKVARRACAGVNPIAFSTATSRRLRRRPLPRVNPSVPSARTAMKAATRVGSERTRSRASRSPGTIGPATTRP